MGKGQILPQSDRLEVLYLPWLQQFGNPSLSVLLTNVEKMQPLPIIKMLLTPPPLDVLAPFSYKYSVLPITKGRLRKRLTELSGLVWF